MTDETQPKLKPAHVAVEEAVTLKTVILDATGLMISAAAAVITLTLLGFGIYMFTTGETTSGISLIVGGALVAALYIFFVLRVKRWYVKNSVEEAEEYRTWQSWLQTTYGLKLNEEQNNQLVNYKAQEFAAKPKSDAVWGETRAMLGGEPTVLRLVQVVDDFTLQVRKNGEFVELNRRS